MIGPHSLCRSQSNCYGTCDCAEFVHVHFQRVLQTAVLLKNHQELRTLENKRVIFSKNSIWKSIKDIQAERFNTGNINYTVRVGGEISSIPPPTHILSTQSFLSSMGSSQFKMFIELKHLVICPKARFSIKLRAQILWFISNSVHILCCRILFFIQCRSWFHYRKNVLCINPRSKLPVI